MYDSEKRRASNLKWNKSAKVAELKRQKKIRAVAYKGGKCESCKGVFHPCIYDFHHVDPSEKEMQGAVILNSSWERIVKELDKCILLCSNCHRLHHYG